MHHLEPYCSSKNDPYDVFLQNKLIFPVTQTFYSWPKSCIILDFFYDATKTVFQVFVQLGISCFQISFLPLPFDSKDVLCVT